MTIKYYKEFGNLNFPNNFEYLKIKDDDVINLGK
jgi:hypothetical protein